MPRSQQLPTATTLTNDQPQSLLQTLLKKYNLESIQQLSHILFDPQLSQLFKQRFPQLSPQSPQPQLSSRLQKMALQHSYSQMYIYYQQFPHLLEQCKNVLKFKYHFDDILRTHNNRKSIWLLCSGALRRIKQNPHYYQSIETLRQQYPQYFSHTIQKDVIRTISQQQLQQRQSLNRILRNFSIRNPYIGYCQGMNFIASFLLQMQFSYGNVLKPFTKILLYQYVRSWCGYQYYGVLHKSLLPIIELKVSINGIKFESVYFIMVGMFIYEYVTILYAGHSLGHDINLWAINFNKGVSDTFRLTIINNTTYNGFISAQLLIKIQQKKKGIFIDENKFIARIMTIYVDEQLLAFCRQLIEIKLQQDKVDHTNKQNKNNLQINCNIQWPICHKTLKSYKKDLGQIQIWTFKQENPPKLIKDYLELRNKQSYKPIQDNRPKQKKLLIGRIPHICDITRYNRKQSIGKQSIQLQSFHKSQRKIIFDKLQSITQKLGIQNQHVKFFKRAAQQKLDLLQFSILNKQNQITQSFSYTQNHPNFINHYQTISPQQTPLKTDSQSNLNKELNLQTKNQTQTPGTKNQTQQHGTVNDELINKKTRNPFKKLKFKWNERKNKQKLQQQP